MKRKQMCVMLFTAATVVTAIYIGSALATPANGFVGTTLATGRFGEIDVLNHQVPGHSKADNWLSMQKTKGSSDLYVQSNVWQPGGSTGWHSHPGHSLIVVTEGTLTAYEGDDPYCKPSIYTVGMGFVDPGDDHVHIIRNETSQEAKTITVQLIPAGATRRIDTENPGHCGGF